MKQFYSLFTTGAACLLAIASTLPARAQLVSGNHFLQGNHVEVGIAPNGSFGSTVPAPAGYHPRTTSGSELGFVADAAKDGWAVGSPNYHGDFFLPGTPQEGWCISSGTTQGVAYRATGGGGVGGAFGGPLFGTNTTYEDLPTEVNGFWEGVYGTSLQITQRTRILKTKTYFTVKVTMKNTGTTTVPDVYYCRTLDPDNDVTLTGSYNTNNKIEYALPNPGNKVMVGAQDPTYTDGYLGLGTMDCRAKAFIFNSGLFPSHPIKTMYDTPPVGSYYWTQDAVKNGDIGIALVYKIGDIAPGDSATITYAYILNKAELEEALLQTAPTWEIEGDPINKKDTLTLASCTLPVVLPLEVENGAGYSWSWSATAATLSETTGTSTNATILGPAVITAIGVGVCGNDTFQLFVTPPMTTPPPAVSSPVVYCQGDPVTPLSATGTSLIWYPTATSSTGSLTPPTPSSSIPGTYTWYVSQTIAGCESMRQPIEVVINPNVTTSIDAVICNGETYTYNGTNYTTTGSHVHHFSTSKGCDSAVTLNITVNPTYNQSIYATTCNGANYYFGGVAYNTTGTYPRVFPTVAGCDSVVTLHLNAVTILPGSFADTICQGETYTWAGGVHTTAGNYTYTFTSPSGCDSVVTLNLHVNPVYHKTTYRTICEGKSETFAGQEYNQTGIYTIPLTTVRGCDSIVTLDLLVTAAPVSSRKDTICEGSSFTLGESTFTETGNYQVRLSTEAGCDSLVNIALYVWPDPNQKFRMPLEGCIGELQVITMMETNVPQGEVFSWNFDGGQIKYGTAGGPFGVIWQETGWQYVTLERPNHFGCPTNPYRDSIFIRPLPEARIITDAPQVCAWDTVTLTAQYQQGYQYQWEPAGIMTRTTGATADMRVQGNRWYSVLVNDGYCQSSDSVYIATENCCSLELPTAFTPNNDGRNDVFRPVAKGQQEIAIFRVMNRWGQVIYESHDQHKGWDGTLGGEPQDIGNYMYFIRYKCADGNYYEKHGDVTLLR